MRLPLRYPAPFQIDHIIARQHGGTADEQNLALACIHCNRFRGLTLLASTRRRASLSACFNRERTSGAITLFGTALN